MILTKIRSVRGKLVIPIAIILSISLGLLILFAKINMSKYTDKIAGEIVLQKSKHIASLFSSDMHTAYNSAQNLVELFLQYEKIEPDKRREAFDEVLRTLLEKRSDILAVYTFWEPLSIDNRDTLYKNQQFETHGAYFSAFYKYRGHVGKELINEDKVTQLRNSDQYIIPKTNRKPVILEPQRYSYTGETKDRQWRISVVLPIIKDNNFLGVVGVDIAMEKLTNHIKTDRLNPENEGFVIDSRGKYLVHNNERRLRTSFVEANRQLSFDNHILEFIRQHRVHQFSNVERGRKLNYTILPIRLDFADQLWALVMVDNHSQLTELRQSLLKSVVIWIVLLIISVILASYMVGNNIYNPLRKINKALVKLSTGNLKQEQNLENPNRDETLQTTQLIKDVYLQLNKIKQFAEDISKGDLQSEYTLQSNKDHLGIALQSLRSNLRKAEEEEKQRRQEEDNQKWVNIGLTKFSDILRRDASDINELSHQIISNLVRYLEANQGGLFLYIDNGRSEPYLELTTAFAYNTRKYLTKKLKMKEGLVGTCALEKETIYLTEIPDDYITITSGLGEALPRTLLIVPLKLEDEIKGVVEIASFNEFEPYQIDFVEQLAESIALTLSTVQINQRTKKLLEQSQKQADELASQEEEMRQNLEELQATQEESSRKEFHMQGLVHAVNNSSYTMEYDDTGKIIEVNDGFLQLLNVPKNELVGKQHRDIITFQGKEDFDYYRFWNDLRNGVSKKEISRIFLDDRDIWLNETYTPLYNTDGEVYKILKIAFDITESKQQAEELAQQKEELSITQTEMESYLDELSNAQRESEVKASEMQSFMEAIEMKFGLAELNENADIVRFNEHIRDFYNVKGEYLGLNIRQFIPTEAMQEFDNVWNEVSVGNTIEKEFIVNTDERTRHFVEVYKPILDEQKKITKVYLVAYEQTEKVNAINELKLIADKYSEYKQNTESELTENRAKIEDLETTTKDYASIVKAVENNLYFAEYSEETKLISFNDNWMKLFHAEPSDVKRKMHNDFVVVENLLKYHVLWSKIRSGSIQYREMRYEFKQKEVYMYDTYIPVFDDNGELVKVFVVSHDITLFKRRELEHRRIISELKREINNTQ